MSANQWIATPLRVAENCRTHSFVSVTPFTVQIVLHVLQCLIGSAVPSPSNLDNFSCGPAIIIGGWGICCVPMLYCTLGCSAHLHCFQHPRCFEQSFYFRQSCYLVKKGFRQPKLSILEVYLRRRVHSTLVLSWHSEPCELIPLHLDSLPSVYAG